MSPLVCRALNGLVRNARSRSVNRLRIAGGLLNFGLGLTLLGTNLAGSFGAEAAATPSLTASPSAGSPGTKVTVTGRGFPARDDGWVFWEGSNSGMPEIMTDKTGAFSVTMTVPQAKPGRHRVDVWITGAHADLEFTVPGAAAVNPALSLSSSSGQVGSKVTVKGSGFPTTDDGWVYWDGKNDGMPEIMTDAAGAFSVTMTVPESAAANSMHTVDVWITGAHARSTYNVTGAATPPPTSGPAPGMTSVAGVVWSADNEIGNLAQWTAGGTHGGPRDSGVCVRPQNGVSTEAAHSGKYSVTMTINVDDDQSGCRTFRHEESARGGEYFYSAWMMIPSAVKVGGFWNIFQFKSDNGSMNEAVWVIEALNRPNGSLHPVLRYKGLAAGPTAGEGTGVKYYDQALKDIPVGRWFHLEMFLRQSDKYDGRVTVWQDGVQLWDFDKVKTQYPGGNNLWSINNYGNNLLPSTATVYVDDARVSKTRVGPN